MVTTPTTTPTVATATDSRQETTENHHDEVPEETTALSETVDNSNQAMELMSKEKDANNTGDPIVNFEPNPEAIQALPDGNNEILDTLSCF